MHPEYCEYCIQPYPKIQTCASHVYPNFPTPVPVPPSSSCTTNTSSSIPPKSPPPPPHPHLFIFFAIFSGMARTPRVTNRLRPNSAHATRLPPVLPLELPPRIRACSSLGDAAPADADDPPSCIASGPPRPSAATVDVAGHCNASCGMRRSVGGEGPRTQEGLHCSQRRKERGGRWAVVPPLPCLPSLRAPRGLPRWRDGLTDPTSLCRRTVPVPWGRRPPRAVLPAPDPPQSVGQ